MRSLDVTEFKKGCAIVDENSLYNLLKNYYADESFVSCLDINNLLTYFNDDRMVVTMEDGFDKTIYITTGTKNSNSCLINFKPDQVLISEAHYNRVGNGVNQEGYVETSIISSNYGRVQKMSYVISLNFKRNGKAQIKFYSKTYDTMLFDIEVDSMTLNGETVEDLNITDAFNSNLLLELFRKRFLQGKNVINNSEVIVSLGEDIKSIEENYSRRYER